jgi:hypothetical protein
VPLYAVGIRELVCFQFGSPSSLLCDQERKKSNFSDGRPIMCVCACVCVCHTLGRHTHTRDTWIGMTSLDALSCTWRTCERASTARARTHTHMYTRRHPPTTSWSCHAHTTHTRPPPPNPHTHTSHARALTHSHVGTHTHTHTHGESTEEGVVLGSAEGLGSDEAVGNAQVQFSQQALVLALDLCTVSKVRKISK